MKDRPIGALFLACYVLRLLGRGDRREAVTHGLAAARG